MGRVSTIMSRIQEFSRILKQLLLKLLHQIIRIYLSSYINQSLLKVRTPDNHVALPRSEDHKPNNKAELARILKADASASALGREGCILAGDKGTKIWVQNQPSWGCDGISWDIPSGNLT
jgi:hypothetical protein